MRAIGVLTLSIGRVEVLVRFGAWVLVLLLWCCLLVLFAFWVYAYAGKIS